jgi:hypothetical protein
MSLNKKFSLDFSLKLNTDKGFRESDEFNSDKAVSS